MKTFEKLNPKATFKKAGEKLIVANIRNEVPEDIHLIVAHKGAKQLYLFNSRNQMIASFPATIGSSSTPSPTGTYKVTGVAKTHGIATRHLTSFRAITRNHFLYHLVQTVL